MIYAIDLRSSKISNFVGNYGDETIFDAKFFGLLFEFLHAILALSFEGVPSQLVPIADDAEKEHS